MFSTSRSVRKAWCLHFRLLAENSQGPGVHACPLHCRCAQDGKDCGSNTKTYLIRLDTIVFSTSRSVGNAWFLHFRLLAENAQGPGVHACRLHCRGAQDGKDWGSHTKTYLMTSILTPSCSAHRGVLEKHSVLISAFLRKTHRGVEFMHVPCPAEVRQTE